MVVSDISLPGMIHFIDSQALSHRIRETTNAEGIVSDYLGHSNLLITEQISELNCLGANETTMT